MPSPQLPRDESLQGGIALVDEGAVASSAEVHSLPEYHRVAIVKYVALAVVGRGRSWRLISELGTPLDRQCLRSVFQHDYSSSYRKKAKVGGETKDLLAG